MHTLSLELSQLSLDVPLNQSGEVLVLCTLALPRPGIQQKTALRSFRLQKGKARMTRMAFHQKALLKEKVDGRLGLTLRLSRPTASPELQNWLRSLAGLGLETTGELLASGLQLSALRPLLREPFDALADQATGYSPHCILEGSLDLHSESLRNSTLTVPLRLTESIRQSDLPPGPKAREKRKTSAKTYKKGFIVGEAVVNAEINS